MAWSGRADCGPWVGSRWAQGPLAGCAKDRHQARGHPQGTCTVRAGSCVVATAWGRGGAGSRWGRVWK